MISEAICRWPAIDIVKLVLDGAQKVIGRERFYRSTILGDHSRYIIAWKLCSTMKASVDETIFAIGSRAIVE